MLLTKQLDTLYDCFLTTMSNVSPYIKTFCMPAAQVCVAYVYSVHTCVCAYVCVCVCVCVCGCVCVCVCVQLIYRVLYIYILRYIEAIHIYIARSMYKLYMHIYSVCEFVSVSVSVCII
jgi:hypothetical protein